MPTLRQIEYWLAVVEAGSFRRAAGRLHIAQPSLSEQVRVLEDQLGGELIERLPGGIRLTAAGKEFLPHARNALGAAERAVRSARAALELEAGELEISTVRSIAAGLLPDLIQTWRSRHPGTSVRLREFTHRKLAEDSVAEGRADIGIGPPPLRWRGPAIGLGWEELVVVLPEDDEAAGATALPLDALAEREWVMFDPDNGMSDLVISACAVASRTPFTPRPAVLTSQVETAARLAAAGVGPTLVPESVVPAGLRATVLRCDPPVGRELTVYARAEWPPTAAAFRDLMTEIDWAQPPAGAAVIA
jgi:DNA-binding transcriptional LysR family regulator